MVLEVGQAVLWSIRRPRTVLFPRVCGAVSMKEAFGDGPHGTTHEVVLVIVCIHWVLFNGPHTLYRSIHIRRIGQYTVSVFIQYGKENTSVSDQAIFSCNFDVTLPCLVLLSRRQKKKGQGSDTSKYEEKNIVHFTTVFSFPESKTFWASASRRKQPLKASGAAIVSASTRAIKAHCLSSNV